jgi:hypothetical protein
MCVRMCSLYFKCCFCPSSWPSPRGEGTLLLLLYRMLLRIIVCWVETLTGVAHTVRSQKLSLLLSRQDARYCVSTYCTSVNPFILYIFEVGALYADSDNFKITFRHIL